MTRQCHTNNKFLVDNAALLIGCSAPVLRPRQGRKKRTRDITSTCVVTFAGYCCSSVCIAQLDQEVEADVAIVTLLHTQTNEARCAGSEQKRLECQKLGHRKFLRQPILACSDGISSRNSRLKVLEPEVWHTLLSLLTIFSLTQSHQHQDNRNKRYA